MGLVLIVVPWSVFWERNFFIEAVPMLEGLIQNNFVRGAVSGLGVVNVWAGLADLSAVVFERRSRRLQAPADAFPKEADGY